MAQRGRRGSRSGGGLRNVDDRTDARERALILLYEAESKDVPPHEVLAAQVCL